MLCYDIDMNGNRDLQPIDKEIVFELNWNGLGRSQLGNMGW